MLKFNTFRANRYLRSKFVEGKFLLASEATDLELEILDLLREQVKNMFGDVALKDAWKVEKLSDTELLIKPGLAWFKGLPYEFRGGKDHLVSGAVLSIGTVPNGVTVSDDSNGDGKILTFGTVGSPNGGNVTPSNTYRIVVTAKEELITEVQDAFLKNANLTESTQQKIRLVFQINIVPEAIQDESPIPYRDENSVGTDAGLTPTNFPDTGDDSQPNLINSISVSPAVGSGDLVSLNSLTGAEGIDGRDLELIINNPVGANPIPDSPTAQSAFSNGKFYDSNGTEYHINFVTNDTVSGRVRIVIDKEYQQPDPVIDGAGGRAYTLARRDVFVTDDINGVPTGKLHWPTATIAWDTNDGFEHESAITDLRNSVESLEEYTNTVNTKMNLKATDGGTIDYDNSTSILSWSSDISLINPHGSTMTIPAASVPMLDGGSLVYDLDLNGGSIEKGSLAINVTSAGATSTIDPISLSTVRVGNVVVDSGGVVAEITNIDDVSNTITTSPALANTGAATIYLDSFAAGKAPLDSVKFCLASRQGAKVYVAGLELEDGESGQIGDGASQELLAFVGSTGDSDDSPDYTTNHYVTDGESLVLAISALDAGLKALADTVAAIAWKNPVADFASLPGSGNTDGDVRLTLDSRIAYHWDNAQSLWLPLTGTGGGIKIIGGSTVSYAATQVPSTFVDFSGSNVSVSGNVVYGSTGSDLIALSFTFGSPETLDSITWELLKSSGTTGNVTLVIEGESSGEPDGITVATSDIVDATTITGSELPITFNFSSSPVLPAGTYFAYLQADQPLTLTSTTYSDTAQSTIAVTSDGGSTWNAGLNDSFNYTVSVLVAGSPALSFAADMYLEKAGLAYTDNTIPTSESPISFATDKDVAYVQPNLVTGGASLTVTVDTLDNVPLTAVIIARRDGDDIIVGSSSTRLTTGESKKLYEGLTDQEENEIYGIKSALFRADDEVKWTGTQLEFSSDIILDILKADGTEQTYTIATADSPVAIANGQYAYLTVDRTVDTATLSLTVGAAPAEATAGSEIIILAKRQDAGGDAYLHIPLHKQVLNPGQNVRLGASGAGSLDIISVAVNTNMEGGKTYLVDTTGGAITMTLPAPDLNLFVTVKDKLENSSTNNITVARNGSENIENQASDFTIDSDGATYTFASDGTDWYIT